MKNHIELIQYLIDKNHYKSYLEIGVDTGACFQRITCQRKIGIDPAWNTSALHWTSDEFFNQNHETFDIIFIDGLHHKDQFIKDVKNSINILNENGAIICHDCNPPDFSCQVIPRQQSIWTGDVWRGWIFLRRIEWLEMFVLDIDFGCGIIRKGKQIPLMIDNPSWEDFIKFRETWLNLKPIDFIYNQ